MSQPYRKHAAGVIQEHDERECTACASSRDCCRPQWRLGYHGEILRVMLINRLASLWDIKKQKRSDITPDLRGHRPQRPCADMCKTGAGAGSSAGADTEPNCRRSNHKWTDNEAERRSLHLCGSYVEATCTCWKIMSPPLLLLLCGPTGGNGNHSCVIHGLKPCHLIMVLSRLPVPASQMLDWQVPM